MSVVASGVLSGLAYKVAYNEVMENIRIGSAFIDASEFRHGPCEALERNKLDMIFLVGTDWSRQETLRTLDAVSAPAPTFSFMTPPTTKASTPC